MSSIQKPTQFYATVSTTIVLAIMAMFLLLFLHTNNITNIAKENLNILVELEDNLPKDQKDAIIKLLQNNEGIIDKSINYVPKAEAMKIMGKDLMPNDSSFINPFKDLIKFNISNQFYSEEYVEKIKKTVEVEKGVLGIYHENESIKAIKSNLDKLSLGLLVLALIFIVLAIAIIFNTIKLTLHSDQKLIKTMQMVGAESSFIKKPYLKTAFLMAVKSFVIVAISLGLIVTLVILKGGMFADIISMPYVILAVILTFIIAFVIQLWATNFILSKYLSNDLT